MSKSSLLLFFLLAATHLTEGDVILIRFYNLNQQRIDILLL